MTRYCLVGLSWFKINMEVNEEPIDAHEEFIKTEPDFVFFQPEKNDSHSPKPQTFKNEHDDVGDTVNIVQSRATGQFEKPQGIKQEMVDCELPKIEQRSELPIKMVNDSLYEDMQGFSVHIKTELNVDEVKSTDVVENICAIYEPSEYLQLKNECELLTTHCDLPTLKIETTDYPDYFEHPSSSKQPASELKPLKTKPCPVCQKNFPSSKSRSKHVDGHFRKRCVIYCPSWESKRGDQRFRKRSLVVCFCGKYFVRKFEFLLHHFDHSVNSNKKKLKQTEKSNNKNIDNKKTILMEPVESEICLWNVKSRYNLRNRSVLHKSLEQSHTDKQFKCDICFEQFSHHSELLLHATAHDERDKPYKCHTCWKSFKQKHTLRQHLIIHTNEKPFQCNICFKTFNQKSNLLQPLMIESNEKRFECDFCSKKFNQKSNLQQHLNIHFNRKPFECEICSKKFNQKSNLQQHLITHAKEKPFRCAVCFKEFNQKSVLHQHLRIHTNEKPFKCEMCPKKFNQKISLQKHLIIHTNKKPFECEICHKNFTKKSSLKRHLSIHKNSHLTIHTNKDTFNCEICSKTFNQLSNLQHHLLIHRKEKPFECYICSKRFIRKLVLQKHVHNSHRLRTRSV